jgi:predicted dehydrogenase
MDKKTRVGVIGFGHMHSNNVAALFAQHPQVQWVACADTVPVTPELREAPNTRGWNLKHALTELGIPKSYDDYREMLKKEQFDIIIITSENAQHPDVVEACAAAGVHMCVEKPMAASLADALRMARACQAAGTTLLTNWPLTWSPSVRKIKALIDEGAIGRVLEVKWRAGHTGPLGGGAAPMTGAERGATWWHQSATGGGAMLDYCCYGAMLSAWFIGEPGTAAIGLKANLDSQWGDAEDNAAMIVRFPTAMALLEGSWTTLDHGVPPGPIVYGTKGTLVDHAQDKVRLEQGHGHTSLIDCPPLPADRNTVAAEFVHHLTTGEPLHQTLEMWFNVQAMAILDAGVRSAASGKLEVVNSAAWQIG